MKPDQKSPVNNSPWIVIPTYNEQENISRMIKRIFSLSMPNINLLIVDDSSPDGTHTTVTKFKELYPKLHLIIRQQKDGLGQAYQTGFAHALKQGASSIVQMDADFSHDPNDIPKLLTALEDHDLILGSRYCNGISVVNWPLKRLLISMAGNIYAGAITGLPYKDSTGGYRAWRKSALEKIDFSTINADGYGFQIATIYRAWRQKMSIKEVPIIFTERHIGQSKMTYSIIWEAIWLVWRLRLGLK